MRSVSVVSANASATRTAECDDDGLLCERRKCALAERVPLPPLICKYYVVRWLADAGGEPRSDLCVLVHSNRCLVLTLSPFHPALFEYPSEPNTEPAASSSSSEPPTQSRRRVLRRVEFGATRASNAVVGRNKRGAQQLEPRTQLCTLHVSDERSSPNQNSNASTSTSTGPEASSAASTLNQHQYVVRSGVRGRLLEVNLRLASEPQLVVEHTSSEGYLGIVLAPLHTHVEKLIEEMLDERQYLDVLRKRGLDPEALPRNPFL